ncbi:capsule assembly Wzi family protein [Algoriphagus confluentis]|uniref:capsule assembly Wzi family protein n=1 Tax=Algoriphagus confluentis TaxID=1697556 RepID=UPI0030C72C6F
MKILKGIQVTLEEWAARIAAMPVPGSGRIGRKAERWGLVICLSLALFPLLLVGQTIPAGFPVLEEQARRSQLLGKNYLNYSFSSRPIRWEPGFSDSLIHNSEVGERPKKKENPKTVFKALPILNTTVFNSVRPYGWGNYGLQNGRGIQNLFSPGVFLKFHLLEIQLRPEIAFSQNQAFDGYPDIFSDNVNFARFRYWNFGDHPERFQGEFNRFVALGQSYFSLSLGKAEVGFGSQNIWWGPGQFSSLLFSNNSRGLNHFFLKTKSPANIGIGLLEAQMIFGRAEDSGLNPSQNVRLNEQYFRAFNGDWRYINGISIAFQPKFLKGLTMGFNRVFQQYNEDVENSFRGRVPVFEVFQKEKLFENGNSVIYDQQAQDQLVSVFFRFHNAKGRFEVYTEFGKHDHNFNWREFILNPEHTRAFLLGFQKLIPLASSDRMLQIKGEIIHQQESVNRHIRYPVLGVINTSWQTHYQVRGFTNYGQSLGAGIGVGSNAQILEVASVKEVSKWGVIVKRIENHQDFYYGALANSFAKKPWIDYSLGLLWDHQWKQLILSGKAELVQARNYQWQDEGISTRDFHSGYNPVSFFGQINLIYLFKN